MVKTEILIFLLTFLTCSSASCFLILFWRLHRLGHRLHQVDRACSSEKYPVDDSTETIDQLTEIKRNLKLPPSSGQIPPRYHYVSALSHHGLETEQIATILDLGPGEVEQLVELANLARKACLAEPSSQVEVAV